MSHSPYCTTSELNMMCDAYEVACERLDIASRDDIMRRRVGKLVIEQSRLGYRSSATLAYTVVKSFRLDSLSCALRTSLPQPSVESTLHRSPASSKSIHSPQVLSAA
jgi:hypothetical protein